MSVSQTIEEAARTGDLEQVRRLRLTATKDTCTKALQEAAGKGHCAIVEALIHLSDPKASRSWALQLAAANGHLDVVNMLIPLCNPLDSQSLALQLAAHNDHRNILAMLIPVSDVMGVAEMMVKRKQWSSLDTMALEITDKSQQEMLNALAPPGRLPKLEAFFLAQKRREKLEVEEKPKQNHRLRTHRKRS